MAELKKLIDRISSGEVSAEAAVPEFRRVLEHDEPSTMEDTWRRMAGTLSERDGTNTFTEVTAAWFSGLLTRKQYDVLRAAVTG